MVASDLWCLLQKKSLPFPHPSSMLATKCPVFTGQSARSSASVLSVHSGEDVHPWASLH